MREALNLFLTKLFGYHLTKSNQSDVVDLLNSKWIKQFNIKTVVDVGANAGQFAQKVREALPDVMIISFEPIPTEFKLLIENFKKDTNFKGVQKAVGNENGMISFELNEFSPTSSILPISDLQKEFYPNTGKVTKVDVPIITLDTYFATNQIVGPTVLKIDVQGFEDKVILGSCEFLKKVAIVYIECSFKEFYEGQPLFDDIYTLMKTNNFIFKGVGEQLNAGKLGEPSQIDAIFINRNLN
jgi:FkbM family methyltransferase